MKQFRLIFICAVTSIAAVLVGCSPVRTTVFPEQDHYTIVATAQEAADAQQGAVKKATATCVAQHGRLVVLHVNTVYQGAGKQLGTITHMMSEASFFAGGPTLPGSATDNDYRVTMQFICK